MEDLNNIWNAEDELNEDQLLEYVNKKATDEAAYNLERKMADSAFIEDGVEGLQQFSSAEKINAYVQQINQDLHYKLTDKKVKKKRSIQSLSWEIIAVIVVIILCLLGYAIITMMH